MKPRIKRRLENVGCAILIGGIFAFWMWIAFLPLSSLYIRVNAMRYEIKEVHSALIELKEGVEANLY